MLFAESIAVSCCFLGIDQLYIGNSDKNKNEYNSIIRIDDKYYFQKYIDNNDDCYEIILKPLEYFEKMKDDYFNKMIDNNRRVTIKDNIYLLYSIICTDSKRNKQFTDITRNVNEGFSLFSGMIMKENTKLLYKKNDSIPYREWINTLKAASFIDSSFFQRYRNIIFFENKISSKNNEIINHSFPISLVF